MQICLIDDIHQFAQLKADWEAAYIADPQAHIFVSWLWLRHWFEITPYDWFVLAVQPDLESSYVAFLPLVRRAPLIYKFSPIRVLHMGIWPMAQYTGFVCSPEYEDAVLAALALYIQQELGWDSFQLEYFVDMRLDRFLKYFPQNQFKIQLLEPIPCLSISLPETWEQYLQDFLGANTRRNLRRSFRQIQTNNELCVTQVQAESIERDIEILLTLWQRRWNAPFNIEWHRCILYYFFQNDRLWLNIFWSGATPIAALAGVIDQQKKTFYAYIVGYNSDYAQMSPGKVVIGYSLQDAIENGFRLYDFLRGTEPYKFSFGPTKQFSATYTIITRKNLRSHIANLALTLARRWRDLFKRR